MDPNQEITVTIKVGALLAALAALGKLPYEQVAQSVQMIEVAISGAMAKKERSKAQPKAEGEV